MLTVGELARRWGVSAKVLYSEIRAGRLRAVRVGRLKTKLEAEAAERAHIERVLRPPAPAPPPRKEVPTFEKFWPRYVDEYLAFRKNRTREASSSIYENWLRPALGPLSLDEVPMAVETLRAHLRKRLRRRTGSDGHKTINNVTAVIGSVLRFAAQPTVGVLAQAPRLGHLPYERPEMEWLDWDPLARIERAA